MSGKGSEFERDICKFLTKWLIGKDKPYQYWRTPLSGGLATIDEVNCDICGDIRSLTPEAAFLTNIFSIEIKTGYPKTTFHQHLRETKTFAIELFWKQAIISAYKSKKLPMLIYRKKGLKTIVGLEEQISKFLKPSIRSITLNFNGEIPNIVFYDFENFFEHIKPDDIRNIKWPQ